MDARERPQPFERIVNATPRTPLLHERRYVLAFRMPSSRPLAILLLAALLGGAGIVEMGCATEATDEAIAGDENELGASAAAAGIKAGSLEEEGVLLLVNDRAVTVDVLKTRTKLTATVANGIVAFRTTPEGAPRWFSTIDEIDALPSTGRVTFQRLVEDANQSGYTEAPGFDPPTLARLAIPEDLGRPPTASDVVVEAGFDGMPAADAALLVRSRLTNTVAPTYDRLVEQTIADTHKAFTLAVGNLFAQGSPHAVFARSLDAERITMLGMMSAVKPTVLLAEKAGVQSYYARGASGGYEPIEAPSYAVIMRAKVRLATTAPDDPGPGVRVFYPAWSAKVLSGATPATDGGPGTDAGPKTDGGPATDAGPADDAGEAPDAGPSGSDAGPVSDGGGSDDLDAGPGSAEAPSGTTLPAIEEEPAADESTPDPVAERDEEEIGSARERSPRRAAPETTSSANAGGCAAAPRGARDASCALVLGLVAVASMRRRRR